MGVSCVDKCKILGSIQGVSLELICQERPRPRCSSKGFFYPFYVQLACKTYTIPENNTLFETIRDTVPVFATAKYYMGIICAFNLFSLRPGVMCMLSFRIFPDRTEKISNITDNFLKTKKYIISTCFSIY